MGELQKLRPDRDLQCYFERPSAIAALSESSPNGFTLSGSFRQQFDWAVIEWNRDNTFEHPAFRNLPDGNLKGLQLSYDETRFNCVPLDSDLYPTVDWPYLRIWIEGQQEPHFVRLKDYATPVEGEYRPAEMEFELQGNLTTGDYVGLSWLSEHYTCQVESGEAVEDLVQRLTEMINLHSSTTAAMNIGVKIRLTYFGLDLMAGANGNRVGVYGFVAGSKTEEWQPSFQHFYGGTSPTTWRISLDFGALQDRNGVTVPTHNVRKMRWTYAAGWQDTAFQRCDFRVRVSNWEVTGTGRDYVVAGPGSRRIEDDSNEIIYSGEWLKTIGNFSGGSSHYTTSEGANIICRYRSSEAHQLFLGTRRATSSGEILVSVDGGNEQAFNLQIPGEDVLVRLPIANLNSGPHTVTVTRAGSGSGDFYFDFLELVVPCEDLPTFSADNQVALATDWDTDHSIAVPAERTAWMIQSTGLHGRVNHYTGAMWFYELYRPGHEYASGWIQFCGIPEFSAITELRINRKGEPPENASVLTHLNLIGDTAETIARAFEFEINRGSTAIRAEAEGNLLRIYARSMGVNGNAITLEASPSTGEFRAEISGPSLTGGTNGEWRTDTASVPRINRAARDWHSSFFRAIACMGINAVTAFSMELQHGDDTIEAGIAQRYPDGSAVLLNTPALQTNFSSESRRFWKEVYKEMAVSMMQAGLEPYLQFGEVQWWYFPNSSGMPFYDAYTTEAFRAEYGRELNQIFTNDASPESFCDEAKFLSNLIGSFTDEVMSYVRGSVPECKFEVLYPVDVNEPQFNRAVNLPAAWTPAKLDCFKTESFTYTYARNLDKAAKSVEFSGYLGFAPQSQAYLVGISDYTSSWLKETRLARARGVESIVLFALDQFSLIGYTLPLPSGQRRSVFFP